MKALFDTNILIDSLNGVEAARTEIERPAERLVSVVTWMEVLAGAHDEAEEDVIELFLRDFRVVEVTRRVARGAVEIRRARRIRLPDARLGVSPCRVRAARHPQHEGLPERRSRPARSLRDLNRG